jgi:hypothetical protein
MVPASEAQRARQEAKGLRDRAKKAEEELDKLKREQMSETEQVKKDNETLTAEKEGLETEARNLRVQVLASSVGIVDPEVASRLLDWSKIDDPSDTKELEKELRALIKDKPYLTGTVAGGADGGAGKGGGDAPTGNAGMNQLLRGMAGKS